MLRIFSRLLPFLVMVCAAFQPVAAQDKELAQFRHECDALFARWRGTHDPQKRAGLRDELLNAAVQAGRPGVVEEVAADGHLARQEIKLPHRARTVPLRELQTFDGIETTPGQEDGYFTYDGTTVKGWLVRRITRDAWEV